ncbi:expressed unknown protein [Seminavis robusta]|uniref:PH domain-containing protein n=1 Tax=Seminavis robusta TaxID=568900 RepID=A0A9N8HF21_9STRA|nr:expressed unknown protein [Seminavis robusta]|eukprot:Sro328_g118670.1 n/a (1026) ;mRNA; r:43306-46851
MLLNILSVAVCVVRACCLFTVPTTQILREKKSTISVPHIRDTSLSPDDGSDEGEEEQRFTASPPRQVCGPRWCLPLPFDRRRRLPAAQRFDYFPSLLEEDTHRGDSSDPSTDRQQYWHLEPVVEEEEEQRNHNNNIHNSPIMEERQDTQPPARGQQPQQQPAAGANEAMPFQGVLWKRRDVFKNKWRPRWFVLQPEEAVLTYYLLSRQDAGGASTISTPLRKRSATAASTANNNSTTTNNNTTNGQAAATARQNATNGPPVNNNNSMHSGVSELTTDIASVSENPVDYDVIPRGTMILLGCTVAANDNLSIPEEGLFALTIAPPQAKENECHLAARTEEARAAWVAALTAACNGNRAANNGSSNGTTTQPLGSWTSQSPAETLFDNVPASLANKLEQSLESHLELVDMASRNWTPIFQDRNGMSAYQRQDLHGRIMMKCTATIPHHPKQILNLLLDSARRQKYEGGVSVSERLEVLNHFTFLDYYSYRAVWPLSARDFAVAVHWQVLHRLIATGDANDSADDDNDDNNQGTRREEAIAIMAFSCPEANALKEPSSSNVRATLHASFYLLRLVTKNNGEAQCNLTRILSYDLGGQIPQNLATTVLMQQAGLPGVITDHLKFVEPTPEDRLLANSEGRPMTNEEVDRDVVEAIVQKEDSALVSSARRRLSFDQTTTTQASPTETPPGESEAFVAGTEISILQSALILLMPLMLHRCLSSSWLIISSGIFEFGFLHPALIFCCSVFLAIRYVVLRSLGPAAPSDKSRQLQFHQGGPVTCQVSVDLKGVLRFVSMKKEEKKEVAEASNQEQSAAEVSVVHIVAIALAKAMRQHADCWKVRRVNLPYLLIQGLYRYPSSVLDLSVSTKTGHVQALTDFQYDKAQDVADALASEEAQLQNDFQTFDWMPWALKWVCSLGSAAEPKHGRCLVVLTESDTDDENKGSKSRSNDAGSIDLTIGTLPDDLDVVVMVGGIRLQRASVGSPLRTSPPRPVLSLSVTINTASLLDIAKCRAFAEDLQKLVQFPELLEE